MKNYDFTTDEQGKFSLTLDDFYGDKTVSLKQEKHSKAVKKHKAEIVEHSDIFIIDKYFSPFPKRVEFLETHQKSNKPQANTEWRDGELEYRLSDIDITGKNGKNKKNRAKHISEMRFNFLN